MMEVKQIVICTVMMGLTGTMAYLIGDLQGFLRGMDKAKEIYNEKGI